MAVLLAGCASVSLPKPRWPFAARPAPAPQAVDELLFESPAEAPVSAFPQYFRRNTLVVDMTAAGPMGAVTLRPRSPFGWPVRVAFRVRPGTFGALEVIGEQRLLLPVVAGGRRPTLDLELPPGFVPARGDRSIELRWGAAVQPAASGGAQSAPTR
jgi:hypothetical protein